MVNVIIRSNEANAAATALTLAARDHYVCLLSDKVSPGPYQFSYFGEPRNEVLRAVDELKAGAPVIGVVFAEGEDVQAGMQDVLRVASPQLMVIVGGGITGAVEAIEAARQFGLDTSSVLHIGAFLVGGNLSSVRAEKHDVLAGFLGPETPDQLVELALATFPRLSLGNPAAVALSSINALFHVPPMLLNAMSVERAESIRFYVEGFGDSVCRLLLALDADRLRLGAALGLRLVPVQELKARYSGPDAPKGLNLREQVNTLSSQTAALPSSFHHRFLRHELRSSFAPMAKLAAAVRVDVPTISSVVRLSEILLEEDILDHAARPAQEFLNLMNPHSLSIN
jgi:opine dehydrogenase